MRKLHPVARPAYERVGNAFTTAYKQAGLRQEDIADALDIDQATVSRWARGLQRIDLDYFPRLDELLGQPTGYLLRLSGYVAASAADATPEQLIRADTRITEDDRRTLIGFYEFALSRSATLAK